MEKPTSWVYFIQEGADGPIKIGYTAANPKSRLAALQTGNAKPLRVVTWSPGTAEDEKALHVRFAHLRMQGEWFQPGPDLLAFVQGVAWTTRAVDPDAEAAELLLECGLSRPDLFEIANFVQAHRLHVMAYRATVKSRGFVPPLTLTLSEAKALRWELATLLQGGESGVDLFGRDGLEDRLHDMDVLIESIQKVEEPF